MILIDTCVLSSLAKIDRLSLLDILFKKHSCYITPSVLKELDTNKIAGFKFVEKIDDLVSFTDAKNKVGIILLDSHELEKAYELKKQYKLALPDCESIILAKSKNAILLTDDGYMSKVASQMGIEQLFDLKSLLGANIIEGKIKSREELEEIIENLKQKDYYVFSDDDHGDIKMKLLVLQETDWRFISSIMN
ncbi:MAG: PIN domain-containing protein [Candidatus Methanoperedens sp.]|nr:PIN domain-containing protein [Candidatus Methanoperedens sp.]